MVADLTLDNVSVSYGRTQVLRGVSARMQPGRIYGLLGLNGAGKSTLFHAILGLVSYSGDIAFRGRPIDLADVGATVNGPAFYPQLTARRNLQVHALLTGTAPARIEQTLRAVGLDARGRRAGSFSTGMKMRLALAMALLTDPSILILDEPQNGLDPQGIKDLRALIRQLADAGKVVIISSHQLDEVAHMVDDVGILASGGMSYEGPLTDSTQIGESFEDAFFRLSRVGEERRGGTAA